MTKNSASDRFLESIADSWDSREQYQQTADRGLSPIDAECLRVMCEESGEEYDIAEGRVLNAVRLHLAETGR